MEDKEDSCCKLTEKPSLGTINCQDQCPMGSSRNRDSSVYFNHGSVLDVEGNHGTIPQVDGLWDNDWDSDSEIDDEEFLFYAQKDYNLCQVDGTSDEQKKSEGSVSAEMSVSNVNVSNVDSENVDCNVSSELIDSENSVKSGYLATFNLTSAKSVQNVAPVVEKKGKVKFYECDDCKMRFSRLAALKKHKTVNDPFRCKKLKRKSGNIDEDTLSPKKSKSNSIQLPYTCKECRKSFQSPQGIRTHLQILHCGETPMFCKLCNKNSESKEEHADHLFTHIEIQEESEDHVDTEEEQCLDQKNDTEEVFEMEVDEIDGLGLESIAKVPITLADLEEGEVAPSELAIQMANYEMDEDYEPDFSELTIEERRKTSKIKTVVISPANMCNSSFSKKSRTIGDSHDRICDICGMGFKTSLEYEDHMDIEHAEVSVMEDTPIPQLPIAENLLEEGEVVLEPGEIKTEGTWFCCEQCGDDFDNANDFVVHMVSHNEEQEKKDKAQEKKDEEQRQKAMAERKLKEQEQKKKEEERKIREREEKAKEKALKKKIKEEKEQKEREAEDLKLKEIADIKGYGDDFLVQAMKNITEVIEPDMGDDYNDEHTEEEEDLFVVKERIRTPERRMSSRRRKPTEKIKSLLIAEKASTPTKMKSSFESSLGSNVHLTNDMIITNEIVNDNVCDICNSNFRTSKGLKLHIERKHIVQEREDDEVPETHEIAKNIKQEVLEESAADIMDSTAKKGAIENTAEDGVEENTVMEGSIEIAAEDFSIENAVEDGIKESAAEDCAKENAADSPKQRQVRKKRRVMDEEPEQPPTEYVDPSYFDDIVEAEHPAERIPSSLMVVPKSTSEIPTERGTYVCEHCNMEFKHVRSCKRHIARMHVVKSLKSQEFEGKKEKDNYMKPGDAQKVDLKDDGKLGKKYLESIDDPNNLVCKDCNRKFENRYGLMVHIHHMHAGIEDKGEHTCGHCGKTFSQAMRLKIHISMAHKGKVLPETSPFDNSNQIENSEIDKNPTESADHPNEPQAEDDPDYNPEEDSAKTSSGNLKLEKIDTLYEEAQLENVTVTHVGKTTKDYKTKKIIEKFKKSDKNYKPLYCKPCNRTFATEANLRIHKTMMHTSRATQSKTRAPTQFYTCRCQAKFNTQEELDHHKESPTCLICKKSFKICAELQKHMKTHSKEEKKLLKVRICNLCGLSFSKAGGLRLHRLLHNICNYCDEQCESSDDLTKHLVEKHPHLVNTICPYCGLRFTKKWNLDMHINRYHNEQEEGTEVDTKGNTYVKRMGPKGRRRTVATCDFCGKTFDKPYEMRRHRTMHTGERNCICEICGEAFSTPSTRALHKRKVHLQAGYPCKICGMEFKHGVQRNRHMEEHEELEKRFTCEKCGEQFVYLSSYNLHLRTKCFDPSAYPDGKPPSTIYIPKERPHKCDQCDASFIWDHMLISHKVQKHHDQEPYECELCKVTFQTAPQLLYHRKSHGKELAEFNCQVCSMEFISQSSLDFHDHQYHTKQRFFTCKACKKICPSEEKLVEHMKIHNEDDMETANCPKCNKTFHFKSALQRHMKLKHNPNKPHRCKNCQKMFKTEDALAQHIEEKHPKGRNFSCQFCTCAYQHLSTLVRHMKDKHGVMHSGLLHEGPGAEPIKTEKFAQGSKFGNEKVFHCNICNSTFYYTSTLRKHMKDEHGIMQATRDQSIRLRAPRHAIKVLPSDGQIMQTADGNIVISQQDEGEEYVIDDHDESSQSQQEQVLYMVRPEQELQENENNVVLSIPENENEQYQFVYMAADGEEPVMSEHGGEVQYVVQGADGEQQQVVVVDSNQQQQQVVYGDNQQVVYVMQQD